MPAIDSDQNTICFFIDHAPQCSSEEGIGTELAFSNMILRRCQFDFVESLRGNVHVCTPYVRRS